MNSRTLAAVLLLSAAPLVAAENPAARLSTPPANAQKFTILSTGGTHGTSATWTLPDGTRMSRDSLLLRGMVTEMEAAVTLGADGLPAKRIVRGVTPEGDAGESFAVSGGTATWKSQVDDGSAPYAAPAMYLSVGGTFDEIALLAEKLIASPTRSLKLLPSGEARIEPLTEAVVGEGSSRKTVKAWAITGLSNSPLPVWTTTDGKFFGLDLGLAVLPVGYESALAEIGRAQDSALAKRSPAIARQFLIKPATPVAFVDVQSYDTATRTFLPHQTVVVDKGVIVSVGPAPAAKVPSNAKVIAGAGKTLVPGLWDAHMHVGDDSTGPMLLALGITGARDPGNDDRLTIARAERRARGELLSPKVYASVLVDGKGPNSAQVATVVTSQTGAVAAVDKAKVDGFVGVKFYGTFNPAWVAPAATQAHKQGLHVHGHVPAGMRPSQAIAAGYDEITHIYFVMMEAMPDSVVNVSNSIQRFNGPGTYARNVDLNAAPMKPLIATMAAKGIVSDPTLVVAESLFVPENGDLSPAYAPYVGTLPPATERGFRTGGFQTPPGVTRADFRASFQKHAALVAAMHKAGVPIVAGTDGSGMEIVRELELYVEAGFTPAEALDTATIATARLVGADRTTGSITVGKAADLVLVEGDPSQRIGDLRHTRVVMMDGIPMDADALRAASGFSGRPK